MKTNSLRSIVAAASMTILTIGLLSQAIAKTATITPAQLTAAKAAVRALHATDQFDSFLPGVARELRMQLTSKDPNYADLIAKTVDEQVLLLAKRRGEFERKAAEIYARYFTVAELKEITKFYTSKTGEKLLKEGPNTIRDLIGAFQIWSRDVSEDLAKNVEKELSKKISKGQTR